MQLGPDNALMISCGYKGMTTYEGLVGLFFKGVIFPVRREMEGVVQGFQT